MDSVNVIQNTVTYRDLPDMIRVAIIDRKPLFIVGQPGVGKSQIPRQVTKEDNIGMIELLGYLFEPVDMRGIQVPNEADKTTNSYSLGKWPFQRFVDSGKIPERGILLLDDVFNAHRDMLTALAEPLLDHTVNGEPLAAGWTIIGTGNNLGSGTSANALPNHVSNRVSFVQVEPSWDDWLVWATGKIRPELLGYFAMQNGIDLFKYDAKKIMPNSPYLTPRSLESLSTRLDAWDQLKGRNAPLHVYSSMVGEYGGKLYATLGYIHELVSWPEIEADAKGCRMPQQPAAIYAQVQIIAGKLRSCGNIIPKRVSKAAYDYICRFNAETTALAMNQWSKATIHSGMDTSVWGMCPEWIVWYNENRKLTS